MPEATPNFGMTDDELLALPTVFAEGLFKDKTVLVSGGGSGLGKATAVLFARLGANIVLCGRNEARLDAAQALIETLGATVATYAITIRDADCVSDTIDAIWDRFGTLDVLVNNAGGQFPQAAIDYSVKGWNAVIDTNLNGTWYMMQAAARKWRDAQPNAEHGEKTTLGEGGTQPAGCIINMVADIWRGMPGIAHTCAARAGVVYLSRSVAVEWAPLGIRVNCVAPGCVETEAFGLYPPEGSATFAESNPQLRPGDVQDIAEACVYLAAPSGKFITGEVLTVDGGQQLWGDPWPTGRPDYFKL
jgi:citronellol/citronellal dehydrogenase